MTTTPAPQRLAHSVAQVTAMTSLGRTTIYGLIQRGELRSVSVGSRRLILHEDLVAYLDRLREEQAW